MGLNCSLLPILGKLFADRQPALDHGLALAPVMVIQQTGEMLKQPSSGSFGASKTPLESSRDALH